MNICRKIFLFAILIVIVCNCGQKSSNDENHEHAASDSIETSGNEALYNEVMKVHDEVMPKMNDIYTLKEDLKKRLASEKELTDEKKKEIDIAILKLDSASESMMVWMRGFKPLPDSLGEEKVREYLETEMEKVKKVREEIQEALSQGKEI